MEAKVIIVTVVKSNKSENNVWMVAITGEEQGQAYCKSAYKAMRFAFKLKKQTGFRIEDASLKALSEEIAQLKAAAAEVEAEKPVEQPAEQEPQVEAKPKKQRKPRSKKAEPVIVPISNEAQSELIAFQ
jgi:hypothetical protein